MALWSLSQPEEHCSEGEVRVANYLKKLPDNWLVRWGFFYRDNKGVRREGDFLILAPFGGVLVLEVKGGVPRQFSPTGVWEGNSSDNPLSQLDAEWGGVIRQIKGTDAQQIFVAKALGLPSVECEPDADRVHGIERSVVFSGNEMRNPQLFTQALMRFFKRADKGEGIKPVSVEAKAAFIKIFCDGSDPDSIGEFVNHTEARFKQQLVAEYKVLDMLSNNQQLLVEGGCGSGKSWYALEQARRYAATGVNVLFLTYNKALTTTLRSDLQRSGEHIEANGRGRIEVRSFEELVASLLGETVEVIQQSSKECQGDISEYYEKVLPARVLTEFRKSGALSTLPKYGAMVVDEAQDHDTELPASVRTEFPEAACGWWSIYLQLLKEERASTMALFYDESQRASFRAKGSFDPQKLRCYLSQAVHVKLDKSIRYTRPLYEFLLSLNGKGTENLVTALGDGRELPEGPKVEIIETKQQPNESIASATLKAVEATLTKWMTTGLCSPNEVLILHNRSTLKQSVLGVQDRLLGLKLVASDETQSAGIRHSSIHKAKGLDAKAVILIGTEHPESEEMAEYNRFTLFMGASRARQLLAVVC